MSTQQNELKTNKGLWVIYLVLGGDWDNNELRDDWYPLLLYEHNRIYKERFRVFKIGGGGNGQIRHSKIDLQFKILLPGRKKSCPRTKGCQISLKIGTQIGIEDLFLLLDVAQSRSHKDDSRAGKDEITCLPWAKALYRTVWGWRKRHLGGLCGTLVVTHAVWYRRVSSIRKVEGNWALLTTLLEGSLGMKLYELIFLF